ncbi:MAG: CYTH domain-containing protein [Gammaproteobacteria bacterium]|nr:CYTH domain-containing protein [Gammaproteobacteria bacterium]
MPQEIERKFLVRNEDWCVPGAGIAYRQGYLCTVPERTVRVRLVRDQGFLTVKGVTVGAARAEYEYEIPAGEAAEMLDELCERPLIEKTRYRVEHHGMVWEIDRFAGDNAGLIIAEVELEEEDQVVVLPDWVGKEVTGDRRYYNANLIAEPFSEWQ